VPLADLKSRPFSCWAEYFEVYLFRREKISLVHENQVHISRIDLLDVRLQVETAEEQGVARIDDLKSDR